MSRPYQKFGSSMPQLLSILASARSLMGCVPSGGRSVQTKSSSSAPVGRSDRPTSRTYFGRAERPPRVVRVEPESGSLGILRRPAPSLSGPVLAEGVTVGGSTMLNAAGDIRTPCDAMGPHKQPPG